MTMPARSCRPLSKSDVARELAKLPELPSRSRTSTSSPASAVVFEATRAGEQVADRDGLERLV